MSVYVFLGPSLPLAEAQGILDAHYRPPVAMGDVQGLVDEVRDLRAIVIIDGLFEQRPAVWHKEILFAISNGVRVYGGSSMGALRAAELHAFGMIGVGAIFEAYRDSVIRADDEVAISHASAEHGYRPLSDAMVNIREGLRRATSAGIISDETQQRMLVAAKSIFYPERTWGALLERVASTVAAEERDALAKFVRAEKPDAKRDDARTLLARVASDLVTGWDPAIASFDFEPTQFWMHAARTARRSRLESGAEGPRHAAVQSYAKLVLTSPTPAELSRSALLRCLVAAEVRRLRLLPPTPAQLADVAERFRRARGLDTAAATHAWMQRNEITKQDFAQMIVDEYNVEAISLHHIREVGKLGVTELKRNGLFGDLAERLGEQERYLEARGTSNASSADTGIDRLELYKWYETRFPAPPATVAQRAIERRFDSLHAFLLELTAFYTYEKDRGVDVTAP